MTPPQPLSTGRSLKLLLFNHADAWGVTLVIASMALIVHDAFTARTLYWLGALTFGFWAAFALNDYYDAPYDAEEPGKGARNFFVRHATGSWAAVVIFLAIGVIVVPAFVQFGRNGLITILIALFIMWAYSAPPLRLKTRPGLDLLVHATAVETFPYLSALIVTGVSWLRVDWAVLSMTFLASLTAQLEQQARDFEVDAKTGGTFTTRIGLKNGVRLLRWLTVLLIAVALYVTFDGTLPLIFVPIALIPLPALLHRFVRPPHVPRSQRLVQLSVAAAVVYMLGLLFYYLVLRS